MTLTDSIKVNSVPVTALLPKFQSRKLTTGNLVQCHADHLLVEIDDTITVIDDRAVEGVSILRRSHDVTLLALEYRDEAGDIFRLHLHWQDCVSHAAEYCRRVSETAAINVMSEFNEYGLIERSGYQFDDCELNF